MKATKIAARLREMAVDLETQATQHDDEFPNEMVMPFHCDAFTEDNALNPLHGQRPSVYIVQNNKKEEDPYIGQTDRIPVTQRVIPKICPLKFVVRANTRCQVRIFC
jgi:hypothetical protein